MIRDISISRRLLALSAFSAIVTVAVGAVALLALWRAALVGREMEHHARAQELAGRIRADALILRHHEYNLRLVPGQPERATELRRRFGETDGRLRSQLFELESHVVTPDDLTDATRIREALDGYDVALAEAFGIAARSEPRATERIETLTRRVAPQLISIDTTADLLPDFSGSGGDLDTQMQCFRGVGRLRRSES
ncbi:MAG: hypothetical protein JW751_22055, partial [Polyangiaceae bacterium]|nr:hypothetical protein [Polyangiaceae bacterium]